MPVIVNHYITHSCLVNIINATLIKMLSLKSLMVLLMLTFEVSVEESVGDRKASCNRLLTAWQQFGIVWLQHGVCMLSLL